MRDAEGWGEGWDGWSHKHTHTKPLRVNFAFGPISPGMIGLMHLNYMGCSRILKIQSSGAEILQIEDYKIMHYCLDTL